MSEELQTRRCISIAGTVAGSIFSGVLSVNLRPTATWPTSGKLLSQPHLRSEVGACKLLDA